jgi:hypothetical protein
VSELDGVPLGVSETDGVSDDAGVADASSDMSGVALPLGVAEGLSVPVPDAELDGVNVALGGFVPDFPVSDETTAVHRAFGGYLLNQVGG